MVLLIGGAALAFFALSQRTVRVDSTALTWNVGARFPYGVFEELLKKYVDRNGRVAYGAWLRSPTDLRRLDSYLATLARYSPKRNPARFPDRASRLAWWLNAYNAFVLKGVLLHFPLASVRDLKVGPNLKPGQGFFFGLRFVAGARRYHLFELEHEIIRRQFGDPRIHFALVCASIGCPPLAREVFRGQTLDKQLDRLARAFINDRSNVRYEKATGKLHLSAIFDWYSEDFGRRDNLVRYVRRYAASQLRSEIQKLGADSLSFMPYNWKLNGRVTP